MQAYFLSITKQRIICLEQYKKLVELKKIILLTFSYYVYCFSFSIKTFTNNNFLSEYFLEIEKNSNKKFLNTKLIHRFLKKRDIPSAYQAFWATWNPVTHSITRKVYDFCGGSKNHKLSIIATFIYSGIFLHMAHPYMIIIYIGLFSLQQNTAIQFLIIIMSFGYSLLGLPLLLPRKEKKQ